MDKQEGSTDDTIYRNNENEKQGTINNDNGEWQAMITMNGAMTTMNEMDATAPKQTLCSLSTSDMMDIASNSILKTSCTISSTSVADTRKWWQAPLK